MKILPQLGLGQDGTAEQAAKTGKEPISASLVTTLSSSTACQLGMFFCGDWLYEEHVGC
jgi:hypothetical protein